MAFFFEGKLVRDLVADKFISDISVTVDTFDPDHPTVFRLEDYPHAASTGIDNAKTTIRNTLTALAEFILADFATAVTITRVWIECGPEHQSRAYAAFRLKHGSFPEFTVKLPSITDLYEAPDAAQKQIVSCARLLAEESAWSVATSPTPKELPVP